MDTSKGQGKAPKTRKAILMKKTTMESMLAYLNGETVDAENLKSLISEELNHLNEKALANAELYDAARDVVLNALTSTPITVADLYEKIKDELPENFSKSKVQYGMLNKWTDKVRKVEQARGANMYMLA